MKMNKELAQRTQKFLELLTYDSMSASYIFADDYSKSYWQFAVEIIYRLLISNLIENEYLDNSLMIEQYCKELANYSVYSDESLVWIDLELSISNKGKQLLRNYIPEIFEKPREWADFNIELMNKLEIIFIESGVPWNLNNPLIKISEQT